jgi:hypothetical protein
MKTLAAITRLPGKKKVRYPAWSGCELKKR